MSLFADLKVCLRFHDNCGKNIKLSNNNQTAQQTSRGGFSVLFCQEGMVISRDPMLTDMLYQVNETFSVCFSLSLSLSLSLCCCLSVCLSLPPPPLSLPDVHSELWKCWTFSTFILQDTSTTPVARPTGTLRCTGEPVDNQGAGLSSCTKSQAKISQLQLLC